MTYRTKEMKGIIETLEGELTKLYSFQDNVRGEEKESLYQGVDCLEDAIGYFKWLIE